MPPHKVEHYRLNEAAMKKLIFLVGTRPEVIKLAPLLRECQKRPRFSCALCTSGQHSTLLSRALVEFALTPDVSFTVWGELPHKQSECLLRFGEVLTREHPDAVIVQGDTLTAFSGGLAAFYHRIPVFHVEAGLRTDTPFSPFPEEFYRRAIDHLSTLHFAPTQKAADHLLREGIAKSGIFTVGNTAIDGLLDDIDPTFTHPLLDEGKKLVLLTLHRRESIGAPLTEMLRGIAMTHIVKYLGITLLPQAGVALGMALKAEALGTVEGAIVSNITLFAVLIYELLGPYLTKIALTKAGDIKPEHKTSARHEALKALMHKIKHHSDEA